MDNATLIEHRRNKDQYFGSDHSPIPAPRRAGFTGLRYFEPNPDLVFTIAVEPGDNGEVTIATSDGTERSYRRAGQARFNVAGEEVSLTLYDTGHPGYFLPFRDATSGRETYGAGRYLDLEPHEDGTVTVDFNLAYNPFCAYSDAYSCALPPVENWLQVRLPAGERSWDTPQ